MRIGTVFAFTILLGMPATAVSQQTIYRGVDECFSNTCGYTPRGPAPRSSRPSSPPVHEKSREERLQDYFRIRDALMKAMERATPTVPHRAPSYDHAPPSRHTPSMRSSGNQGEVSNRWQPGQTFKPYLDKLNRAKAQYNAQCSGSATSTEDCAELGTQVARASRELDLARNAYSAWQQTQQRQSGHAADASATAAIQNPRSGGSCKADQDALIARMNRLQSSPPAGICANARAAHPIHVDMANFYARCPSADPSGQMRQMALENVRITKQQMGASCAN